MCLVVDENGDPVTKDLPVHPDLWRAVSHLLSHWDEHRKCFDLCVSAAQESAHETSSESYPGELRSLLQMAETANRTGFTLPESWGPRVRALLECGD